MTQPPIRPGFTLVELLVVITIVVLLLSLLMPALDTAVYQAELAVCGSNLDGIAMGANTYAADYRGRYPHRAVLTASENQPLLLQSYPADDRPHLRTHIPLKLFIDPLAGKFPIEVSDTPGAGVVFSGYELWFGVLYSGEAKGMMRQGDRWEFTASSSLGSTTHRFNLLAGDFDWVADNDRNINSHPDDLRMMSNWSYAGANGWYFTRWEDDGGNAILRGLVDQNYVWADGSVERLTKVEIDDERTVSVPYLVDRRGYPVARVQLPRP